MKTLHRRCAGLDVHSDSVVACARVIVRTKVTHEVRRFSTATRDLLEMADWLAAQGITHVAMEATGVYWKPIWHILEGRFELILANAAHIRNVPGRKSDVNDAVWISDLLAHGLIRASFVPPAQIARSDEDENAAGTRDRTTYSAYSENAGGRQHQADVSDLGHRGHERAAHFESDDRGRDERGQAGRARFDASKMSSSRIDRRP